MEFLNISLRLFAASQLLLFLLLTVFSDNPKRVRGVGALLMLGIICYLLMPLVEDYTPYHDHLQYYWFFSAITPSLLLLFVWFIFEENCRLPYWLIGLVSFSVLASLWFQFTKVGLPGSPLWLQALKTLIAALCVFVVWRGRDNDLVEMRSRARNIFAFALALMTLIVITVEVYTKFDPPLWLDTATKMVMLIYAVSLNFFFIKLNPQATLMQRPVPVREDSADPLITELLERMRSERLYADHDLRVGSLASLLNVPEYRLRSKINQQLGYRNFNQFVNHYRIEEAGVKLREDKRTPVLSIALDVGFRSISSFNSAFQAQFGVSPTKYRAEAFSSDAL